MSYVDHARRFLATMPTRGEARASPREESEECEEWGRPHDSAEAGSESGGRVRPPNERYEAGVGPPPNRAPFDPVLEAMASAILAFSSDELAAYRVEMAHFPADDPPSEREWAALALAERARASGTVGTAA